LSYCIDYRSGGLGNTVVSHVLYACQRITLDLDNFFSDTGDAHKIQESIGNLSLIPYHLIENPTNNLTCIVELKSNDWFYVLQHRMAYAKWHKKYPTVKDVNNDNHELECLSINYYDQIQNKIIKNFDTSVIYLLGDYFNNNYDILKTQVVDRFGWQWNQQLSDRFYKKMLEANLQHLNWLANMKSIYSDTVNFVEVTVNLEFWERAMLIGKLCQHFNVNPQQLNWSDQNYVLSDNNVSLINYFKKVNRGQAI
jgi:hypothetical protein